MQKDKVCGCRLAELDMYEFTGVTAAFGPNGVLEMVDTLVTQAIRPSGASTEREERWFKLTVDQQPEHIRLVYASSGVCPADMTPLVAQGAKADLHQYPDAYDLTVVWTAGDDPEETGEDGPC